MEQRRAALVEAHLALVEQVVLKVSSGFPRFVDRSELISAGMLGLVEAANRYDFDRSVPFAGYAVQRIRGAVLDVARSVDWTPRPVRHMARQVEDATQELANRLRHRPDDDQVATAMGVDPAVLRDLRERVNFGVLRALDDGHDLDRPDESSQLRDRSASEPDELLESAELSGYLRSALHTLPERHRMIIVGLYFEDRSFEELADLLGVTPSRISQLRSDAVQMIKDGIEAQFEPTPAARPKGRVEIRQARYAADIARHADWRTRISSPAVAARRDATGATAAAATSLPRPGASPFAGTRIPDAVPAGADAVAVAVDRTA
jgi:RNA polymerase sigma factor FliA